MDPLQLVRLAAGTSNELRGVKGLHCPAGIWPAATRSAHGLLLLAWNVVGAFAVVSVASNDPT